MRDKTATDILKQVSQIDQDRSDWLDDQVRWYEFFRGIIPQRTASPAEGGWANYHVPVTAWTILRIHASLMNIYEASDPLVFLKPKNSVAAKWRPQSERYFNSVLKDEDQIDFLGIADETILQTLIHGGPFGFLGWDRWNEYTEDYHAFEVKPEQPLASAFQKILMSLFPGRTYPEKDLKLKQIKRSKKLNIWEAKFKEKIEEDSFTNGQAEIEIRSIEEEGIVEVTYRGDKLREKPIIEVPPVEQVFVSRDVKWLGIDRCKMIGRKFTLTMDEIEQNFADNNFDLLSSEKLKELRTIDEGKDESDLSKGVDEARQSAQGMERRKPQHKIGEFDGIEVFTMDDPLKRGLNQQWIYTLLTNPPLLLRAKPLHRVVKLRNGRRPVFQVVCFPDKNSPHGFGYAELLEGPQLEINEIHSIGIDWGHISNAPWFMYPQASTFKPDFRLIQPGGGVPVEEPRDIVWPQWTNTGTAWAQSQELALLGYLERLGIPDIGFGRVPAGRSSAFRTLGTTQLLLGQADARLEVILHRLNRGFSRMASILWDMEGRERKIPLTYLLPTENGNVDHIAPPREAVDSPFTFQFAPTTLVANKDFLRQREVEKLQVVGANPLFIQGGIVTTKNLYEFGKKILKAFDEDEVNLLLTAPEDASDVPVLTGRQVLQYLQSGNVPKISPLANIEEQLTVLAEFVESPEFLGLPPDVQMRIFEYAGLARQLGIAQQARNQLAQAASMMQLGGMGREGQVGRPAEGVNIPIGPPNEQAVPLEERIG